MTELPRPSTRAGEPPALSDAARPSRPPTADAASTGVAERTATPVPKREAGFHRYPFYSPRFWHGMRPAAWFRLLASGRLKIHPTRVFLVIGVSLATPVNTLLAWMQWLLFRRSLASAELQGPPVFIVGHWRSGTTLLHELMVRDERLSSPSTFQCFAPHHFLVSEWFFRRYASWLLPGKRPMDDMAAGWDRPQEDEFALLTLGLPSPYRRMAFPNQPPPDMDYLDFDGVPEPQVRAWLKSLRAFLLSVSTATGRPLIIKSPTHTGRVAWLASEFPEAKFIHITRDPRELFPSTCRLWRGLDEVQALQRPSFDGLDDYVIACLQRMYRAFDQQRQRIDDSRIIDVRYEDLIRDPVETLRRIYETLRLSDFDSVQPSIQDWVDSEHRDYKPNRHQLDPEQESQIRRAWATYFENYGYT